jgi:hypothetical protein
MNNENLGAPDIRYFEQVLREAGITIFVAQVKLALLWLPAMLGVTWAIERALDQRDIISERRYAHEEFAQNLWKLRKYGTTLAMLSIADDGCLGYDGWLDPEDRYQEGTP